MISDAPTLAPAVFAFGFAGIACVLCFVASLADEVGLEFPALASINWAAFRPAPPAPVGPVWCEGSRRWRDPVTLRFVKAPR